jgi:hypothetical protein
MGEVITFYSYKGGTGRSMTLANMAWLLAADRQRVLVIDWDLEAPGIHHYFRPFLVDPDLFETKGLIDAFWEVVKHAFTPAASGSSPPPELALAGFILLPEYLFRRQYQHRPRRLHQSNRLGFRRRRGGA